MRLTPVVKNLLILNVIVFIAAQLDLYAGGSDPMNPYSGVLGLYERLSLFYPASPYFQPYQLVTHFFMHADLLHIAFNMFALAMFGPPIEALLGHQRFLTLYLLAALGSAALHLGYTAYELSAHPELAQRIYSIPMLGASGAVFGVLTAFGMKFPDTKLALIFLPIPIKARYFIPGIMALELFLGVQRYSWDNIAHFAHLGGAVVGFLLILYFRRSGPSPRV